ncbi:MAG: methylenetetrahydrofolate reductase C-terminal domain-containing protein [Candidatus Helarchaeota archaeon]|nr:methylenetetrahydrofolate reductase C-terminal domain-containing protein [Candidatus Helarchaeota archaeon]
MIITQEKSIEEIDAMLETHKKILILGCSGCFQPPRRGKQADILREKLESKRKLEKKEFEAKTSNVSRQCDDKVNTSTIKPLLDEGKFDAILSLACGVGVQVAAEMFDIPVYPAQNTMFMGAEIGDTYYEKCAGCGDCLLGYTGGFCPIANCAKSLVNGPCGGPINGKCEVGDYTKPCAWIKVFKRLNSRPGGLELFKKFRTPVDFKIRSPPREIKKEVSES